jgi:glycogen phosphorylase
VAARTVPEKDIQALIEDLKEVAHNLWWSWNPEAQDIFHELSPFFWDDTNHNAVEVMNWVSGQELSGRLADPAYFRKVQAICKNFQSYMQGQKTWGSRYAPSLRRRPVAYFSMEFGLHESLRIYSGGLGILAGDHAKAASDLGVPLVGITLFYRQGYFEQRISADGWQQERYPVQDPKKLPIRLVTDSHGKPIIESVEIGNDVVKFQGWEVPVGRVSVYLLDTDLPENDQKFRDLTAHVYGGDQWNRISQEIVLGIGGVRFLRALGIRPSVYHMNEGHSAFLTLELLRDHASAAETHADAMERVRGECVFTTHTPVPAGHDRFDAGLMGAALPRFAASLGMTMEEIMKLGRLHPDQPAEPFTMTVLALRMSRGANGVSELHGDVSRRMWQDLYPGKDVDSVPITAVTNGVHIAGWTTASSSRFWSRHVGEGWHEKMLDGKFWKDALTPAAIPDEELWALRTGLRRELLEFARKRVRQQMLRHGGDDASLSAQFLSPDALTIGFARRFATYKRAPLFFRDLEWAIRILTNEKYPVQMIFAGKAHPRDDAGKRFIQEIVNITKRPELAGKVMFLEDYDINVARYLVSGSDIWLNTPRRPNEACGTSGMKAIMSGALHVSTMDGWWREAFDGQNGWQIGDDAGAPSEYELDEKDAASLRLVIENEVIPLFYNRGRNGLPHAWLKRVRHSLASLIPVYNTHRMVAEYTKLYYCPQAKPERAEQEGSAGTGRTKAAGGKKRTRRRANVAARRRPAARRRGR